MSAIPIILDTIKKTLGISLVDNSFDTDLMVFINASLATLSQLGLKETDATPMIDETTTWVSFLGTRTDLEMVKSYIYFKTKLMFDPPTNSAALDAIKRSIDEMEWRITNLEINKGVI